MGQVTELRAENSQLREESDKARLEALGAVSRQRTLEESLALLEAEASERSRKFALVQRTFRAGESEMRDRLEALTEELNAARNQQARAEAQVKQALEEAQAQASERSTLQQELDSGRLSLSRLEAEMAEQVVPDLAAYEAGSLKRPSYSIHALCRPVLRRKCRPVWCRRKLPLTDSEPRSWLITMTMSN